MSMKHTAQVWKKPAEGLGDVRKDRLIQLRKEPVINRIDKPTRIDRARSLGYKAKKGHAVVRIRIGKGRRKTPNKGRRSPKASGRFFSPGLSHRSIAEQRVARKFPNMEVIGSYSLLEDGKTKWYEVLVVDTKRPEVSKDPERKWIADGKHKRRVYRGKTSSGKKSRGHTRKGKGAEKLRPSLSAKQGRGK